MSGSDVQHGALGVRDAPACSPGDAGSAAALWVPLAAARAPPPGASEADEATSQAVRTRQTRSSVSKAFSEKSSAFSGALVQLGRQATAESWATFSPASRRVSLVHSFQSGHTTRERLEERHATGSIEQQIERGTLRWCRREVRKVMSSNWFDAVIGVLVAVNAILIGVEQTYRLEQREVELPEILVSSEHIFLSIYVVELLARFFGFGWRSLEDNWVKFDCLLVGSSIMYVWCLQPLETGSESGGFLFLLRTVRLARLARTLRLLIKFRVLWMLVRGLLSSAGTMIYTLIVLLIMLYVFATIGTELITLKSQSAGDQVPEEFQEMVDRYFATLPEAMLTLMQFACLDSIGAIYRPMIQYDYSLAAYFLVIILIIPVVLMNLVTAIIVNGAMEQAMQDKDAQKLEKHYRQKELIRKVSRLFHELDGDHSGKVSREEMRLIGDEEREILCHLCGMEEDPLVIFDRLDVDGSGELDIDEFCSGIWKAVTAATPIEMQRIEKQMAILLEKQRENDRRNEVLTEWMRSMQAGVSQVQASLHCIEDPVSLRRSCAAEDLDSVTSRGLMDDRGGMFRGQTEAALVQDASCPTLLAVDEVRDTSPAAKRSRAPSVASVEGSLHLGRHSASSLPSASPKPPPEHATASGDMKALQQQLFAARATIAAFKQQQQQQLQMSSSLLEDPFPLHFAQLQQLGSSPTEDSAQCLAHHSAPGKQDERAASPNEARPLAGLQQGSHATGSQAAVDTRPALDADGGDARRRAGSPASSPQVGSLTASVIGLPAATQYFFASESDTVEQKPAAAPKAFGADDHSSGEYQSNRSHRVEL